MQSQDILNYEIHNIESAPSASIPLLESSINKVGKIPNLHGVMANLPGLLEAYQTMDAIYRQKSLFDKHEQEVILLTINVYNKCHYCVAAHSVIADSIKLPREVTDAIRNSEPIEDKKLEGLRRFTETMLEKKGWVENDDIEAFLNLGYTQNHILNIVIALSYKVLSNYTNHISNTEVDRVFKRREWSAESIIN